MHERERERGGEAKALLQWGVVVFFRVAVLLRGWVRRSVVGGRSCRRGERS